MVKRGFTLIEIMVVISIIGILVTFGQINYVTGLKKARDGKRKAEIEQIRGALEMARSDSPSGQYPSSITTAWVYMTQPAVSPGYGFVYTPAANRLTYTLWVCLEWATDPAGVAEAACTSSGIKYEVKNP